MPTRTKLFALQDAQLTSPVKDSACRLPRPGTQTSPTSATRNEGDGYKGRAVFTDGGTHTIDGETTAGWGAVARSPNGRQDITTDADLAHAGARLQTNNTAELSSIFEALSFLGLPGPVARFSQACIFHDSKHAANVWMGTTESRTNVTVCITSHQNYYATPFTVMDTM